MKQKRYKIDDYTEVVEAKGLGEPICEHYCPSCKESLWADKNHKSYHYCCYCGKNLKGVKLPYEFI